MLKEELVLINTEDREQIALWKIQSTDQQNNSNVFLTHGTFSDKRICLGIAKYLAKIGYTCWIMEWRNHGTSPSTTNKFNFETIGLFDIKAAFQYLHHTLNISNLHCITHSGGGICLTMFLIKNPSYKNCINSISFFGCQAFGAAKSSISYISLIVSKSIIKLFGVFPASKNGRPHDETYYTMKQWYDWNIYKEFKGSDGYDYLSKMKTIKIPILSVCAKGDHYVAPKVGCQSFLDAFKNPLNKLVYCSKEDGYIEDYDHGRILLSSSAAQEIWPVVREWIERYGDSQWPASPNLKS